MRGEVSSPTLGPQLQLTQYLYDPLGALQQITIGERTPLIFTHDDLGRETRRESAVGFRLSQAHDKIGQLTRQWADAETGLYYNRFRYYDARAAQYISPDPIGLGGGLRSQGYVNNPSYWTDPLGLAKSPASMPSIPGFQRHHIIPWDFHDHPAIRRAGNLFNMGGVQNIMYLPECVGLGGQTSSPKTAGTHRGNTTEHRDYSDEMEGNLDTIFRRNMSRKCTARAIRKLALKYRTLLGTGAKRLGKHGAKCK